MSIALVDWAMDLPVRPAGRKFVLVCIAEACGPQGHGFPGQAYVARRTSMSVSTVREHLAALEKDGWIKRTHRYRKNGERSSDAFQINPHRAPLNGYEAPEAADEEPWPEGPLVATEDVAESAAGGAAAGANSEGGASALPPESGGSASAGKADDYRRISEGLPPESGGYNVEPSGNQEVNQTRAREGGAAPGAPPSRASGETNSDLSAPRQSADGGAGATPAPGGGGAPGGEPAGSAPNPTSEARALWLERQDAIPDALATEAEALRERQEAAAEAWEAALAALEARAPQRAEALARLREIAAPWEIVASERLGRVLRVAFEGGYGRWRGLTEPGGDAAGLEEALGMATRPMAESQRATPEEIAAAFEPLVRRLFVVRAEEDGTVTLGVADLETERRAEACCQAALARALGRPVRFEVVRRADEIAADIWARQRAAKDAGGEAA